MNRSYLMIGGALLSVAIALGIFLMPGSKPMPQTDDHTAGNSAPDGDPADAKGPHGGRMLRQGSFALEVTIYEEGIPPEFRLYAYENDKALAPGAVSAQIQLGRLGAAPETIAFDVKQDFLLGNGEITEPHSFTTRVTAQHKGQSYNWDYEQIEGRIAMDDATAQGAGIRFATAGPMNIRSSLQLAGEIQFNQDRLAHVVPRLDGVVIHSGKNLGDQVRKGEMLAILESTTLASLKSEYLASKTRLDLSATTFEREKRLWEEKISAEQDYLASRQALAEAQIAHRNAEQKLLALGIDPALQARSASSDISRYEIRAPFDGVVIEKHLTLGESVKDDASIFTIADLSTVWAEMTIYPKDLDSVKLGQNVTVRATGLETAATGRVSYVGALIGEQSRSAKARVTLQNPNRSWRPGLFVAVELVQSEARVAVAVEAEAIQTYRDWKAVFVRFGDLFEARPVELGRSDGQRVEVISGVPAGTEYAATGSFVLKADLGKSGASHDH